MSKENLIKETINIFCQYYRYNIEEFNSKREGQSFWGVSRLGENYNEYMVFLDLSENGELDTDYIYNKHRYENVRIIKVFYIKNKENINWSILSEQSKEEIIVVDKNQYKIVYCSEFARENAVIIERIMEHFKRIKREKKAVKVPVITSILILTNIIMFLLTAYLSGSIFESNTSVLLYLGAKENTLIGNGEYYRLISAMFLHGGIVHIGFNMYALYFLGTMVERAFGKLKFILIYFIGGISSSLASYFFSQAVSVGASGAIFALLGAILIYNLKMGYKANKAMIGNIVSVIFTNIVIGFILPNIDNFGHLGGLAAGLIVTLLIINFNKRL
ncbi:rhomboid protease GluP [Clostridium homopropionicum DSM 5847]|uniref:Rhomboid protease GluP n=1 Tax=Clostridium homopropionicum DSM 5847 TaxID=1121318 RepID=A0A0L6Z8S8_9CLOT|nr:rhomboid family intramembrane serine protease [Clostridium homopropionicum]KOA19382.1 rhomboid protease GluP [Clostridium homopropionicum DSM 5847]SFG68061.1 rhomboid protease GluP [Clostridium homopropionicum]